jgi:hypothetical protein
MKILYCKKGDFKLVMKILLILLTAGIMIYILYQSGVIEKVMDLVNPPCTKILGAKGVKGMCVVESKNCPSNYVPSIRGDCVKGSKCCITDMPPPPSAECKNKNKGDNCGSGNYPGYKICDEDLQCISRCLYCVSNNDDELCKKNAIGVNVTKDFTFDSGFDCTCTLNECNAKLDAKQCIKQFCPSSNTEKYCCVK